MPDVRLFGDRRSLAIDGGRMTNNEVEKRLWGAADQLRANSKFEASEYCMPGLGLIFLCRDRSVVAWSIEAGIRRGLVGGP